MSTRVAELAMAILMGVFSLYLMYKSAELPVGWIPDEGPGGGAWPFWLSVMMLLSCVGIIVNWARRKGSVAVSEEPYIERGVLIEVGLVALALIVTVGTVRPDRRLRRVAAVPVILLAVSRESFLGVVYFLLPADSDHHVFLF